MHLGQRAEFVPDRDPIDLEAGLPEPNDPAVVRLDVVDRPVRAEPSELVRQLPPFPLDHFRERPGYVRHVMRFAASRPPSARRGRPIVCGLGIATPGPARWRHQFGIAANSRLDCAVRPLTGFARWEAVG
jgi:hypothetical protein